jgi:hypothetical protein
MSDNRSYIYKGVVDSVDHLESKFVLNGKSLRVFKYSDATVFEKDKDIKKSSCLKPGDKVSGFAFYGNDGICHATKVIIWLSHFQRNSVSAGADWRGVVERFKLQKTLIYFISTVGVLVGAWVLFRLPSWVALVVAGETIGFCLVYLIVKSIYGPTDLTDRNASRRGNFIAEHTRRRSVWQKAGHVYRGDEADSFGKSLLIVFMINLVCLGISIGSVALGLAFAAFFFGLVSHRFGVD